MYVKHINFIYYVRLATCFDSHRSSLVLQLNQVVLRTLLGSQLTFTVKY